MALPFLCFARQTHISCLISWKLYTLKTFNVLFPLVERCIFSLRCISKVCIQTRKFHPTHNNHNAKMVPVKTCRLSILHYLPKRAYSQERNRTIADKYKTKRVKTLLEWLSYFEKIDNPFRRMYIICRYWKYLLKKNRKDDFFIQRFVHVFDCIKKSKPNLLAEYVSKAVMDSILNNKACFNLSGAPEISIANIEQWLPYAYISGRIAYGIVDVETCLVGSKKIVEVTVHYTLGMKKMSWNWKHTLSILPERQRQEPSLLPFVLIKFRTTYTDVENADSQKWLITQLIVSFSKEGQWKSFSNFMEHVKVPQTLQESLEQETDNLKIK